MMSLHFIITISFSLLSVMDRELSSRSPLAVTVKIASTLDYEDFAGDSKEEDKPIPYGITAFPAGVVLDIIYIPQGSFPQVA